MVSEYLNATGRSITEPNRSNSWVKSIKSIAMTKRTLYLHSKVPAAVLTRWHVYAGNLAS